jgi:hypothetical protein
MIRVNRIDKLSSMAKFFWLLIFIGLRANANTYTVTDPTDGTAPNQLRGAILAADAAGGGPHTINVPPGTYNLTLGEISFGTTANSNISILGTDASTTVINMTTTGQDRIFLINPSGQITNVNIAISGIAFLNGHLRSDQNGGGAVLCGGPGNTVSISNCIFNSNTIDPSHSGGSGGALAMVGGGNMSIDHCTLFGNSVNTGDGGALYYFLPNSTSGSLTVTRCQFTNNKTTGATGSGGAMAIGVAGSAGSTTSSITIQRNSFLLNQTAAGFGGAIAITNSFSPTNSALINYNRLLGNTASAHPTTSALGVFATQGNVDATNNWWGCNTGPTAATGCDKAALTATGGTGTLDLSKWLQLTAKPAINTICSGNGNNTDEITAGFTTNSAQEPIAATNLTVFQGTGVSFSTTTGFLSQTVATIQPDGTAAVTFTSDGTTGAASVSTSYDNVPANDASAKASFTIRQSPSITTQPSPATPCAGNTAVFNVAANGGTTAYQWYNGATLLTDGAGTSGSTLTGTTTATLTVHNATPNDNGNYHAVADNGCPTTSNDASLTVAPPTVTAANTTIMATISADDSYVDDGACNRVIRILPSGASPLNGSLTAKVTVDDPQSANGQPYVKRHYDVEPVSNAATATATMTLYAAQADFDSYNALDPNNHLPTGPSDAQGIANLRVTQFHGAGTTPGNYSGWTGSGPATVLLQPAPGNIVWNASTGYWEITFDVTGFSGFYLSGLSSPLPVKIESFTAHLQSGDVLLGWTVGVEQGTDHYEIERSIDGRNFSEIGSVPATGDAKYAYIDNSPPDGASYYRLKMVDKDGASSYSTIVSVNIRTSGWSSQVRPNPFRDALHLTINSTQTMSVTIQMMDPTGRALLIKEKALLPGANDFDLAGLVEYSPGVYYIRVTGKTFQETIKVMKMY